MQGLLLIGHYLVSLYVMLVLLRFLAQWLGADFRNPISQVIVQATNPALLPLRRLVPGWKGQDMASVVLALLIISAEIILLSFLFGVQNHIALVPIIAFRSFIIVINIYFYVLIISAIISWVNRDPYHPAQLFFGAITAPLLRPLRQYIKPIGGVLDLSPMVILLIIYFLQIQAPLWFLQIMQSLGLASDVAINALIGLMAR